MGGLVQGIGTAGMGIWAANDAQTAANQQWSNNDRLLGYQQRLTALKGNIQAGQVRAQGSQTVAAQGTAYANSGIDEKSGTAVQVQANTAAQSELDAQTVANNAAREVWGFKIQRAQNSQNLQTQLNTINRQAVGSIITGASQAMGGGAVGGGGGGSFGGGS